MKNQYRKNVHPNMHATAFSHTHAHVHCNSCHNSHNANHQFAKRHHFQKPKFSKDHNNPYSSSSDVLYTRIDSITDVTDDETSGKMTNTRKKRRQRKSESAGPMQVWVPKLTS